MDSSSHIISAHLSPVTTIADVEQLYSDAKENGFAKLCVPPLFVKKMRIEIADPKIDLATVIGFPFGYSAVEAKLAEIVLAILDGVDELFVVANIAALKNNDWQYLAQELNAILPVIRSKNKKLGIIIEAGILTNEEIVRCCDLYGIAGVDHIITSTGYASKGASRENVNLIRRHLADAVAIIASGNVNDPIFAKDLLEEGAAFVISEKANQLVKMDKKP